MGKNPKPSLVILPPPRCLHNLRREANRFTPHLKVLVLESGAARHGNSQADSSAMTSSVTNYALLPAAILEELQKFSFRAVHPGAKPQFIKNPGPQGHGNRSSN